jgi:hypothetical protein
VMVHCPAARTNRLTRQCSEPRAGLRVRLCLFAIHTLAASHALAGSRSLILCLVRPMTRSFWLMLTTALVSAAAASEPFDAQKLKQANALIEHLPSKPDLERYRIDRIYNLVDAETLKNQQKIIREASENFVRLRSLIETGRSVHDYRGLLGLGNSGKYHDVYAVKIGVNTVQDQGVSKFEFRVIYDGNGIILRVESVFYNS